LGAEVRLSIVNPGFSGSTSKPNSKPDKFNLQGRRLGAADLENLFGSRGYVHQNITGIGAWTRRLVFGWEKMGRYDRFVYKKPGEMTEDDGK